MVKYRYSYSGPVMGFDHLLTNMWSGETIAASERKAKSNLAYKFKNDNNLSPGAKISLPGKCRKLEVIME